MEDMTEERIFDGRPYQVVTDRLTIIKGREYVECPLHGLIPLEHHCAKSPSDHWCREVAHPDYDPEDGDQGCSHEEWSGFQGEKMHRILGLHVKTEGPDGMTDGTCAECWHTWPCPTYHVAAGWGLDSFYECEDAHWCSHEGVPM